MVKNGYPSLLEWIDLSKIHNRISSLQPIDWNPNFISNNSSLYSLFEGDNLYFLHTLVESQKESFSVAFFDPPYNSTQDFVMNDFSNENVDFWEHGTSHKKWLRMLYSRLLLTKELLDPDVGVVIFCIDDKEVHFSRLLLDAIFGEYNYVGTIIWQSLVEPKFNTFFTFNHTYILVYAKNLSALKKCKNQLGNPSDPLFTSLWTDLPSSLDARDHLLYQLHPYIPDSITRFLNPKPIKLLYRLLSSYIKKIIIPNPIKILDPFAGTGSLLYAINQIQADEPQLKLKYYGCQYPVYLTKFDPDYHHDSIQTIVDIFFLRQKLVLPNVSIQNYQPISSEKKILIK